MSVPTPPSPPPPQPPPAGAGVSLVIPRETQEKFAELIELIKGSESMNDEERQYWINILPIMTPEQTGNLKQILVSEREQLAAIDKKYSKEMQTLQNTDALRQVGAERREKITKLKQVEQKEEAAEEASTEDLLKKISEQ